MKFVDILSEAMDARQEFWKGIEDEGKTDWDEWDRLDRRDDDLKAKDKEINGHNGHFDKQLVAHDNKTSYNITNPRAHVAYQERAKKDPKAGQTGTDRFGRPLTAPNYGPKHGASNQVYTLTVKNNDDAINAANAHIEEFRQELKSKYNAEIVNITRQNKRNSRAGTNFSIWTIDVNSPVVKTKIDKEWQDDVAKAKDQYKKDKSKQNEADKKTQRTRLNTLKSYLKISPNVMTRFREVKAELGSGVDLLANGSQQTFELSVDSEGEPQIVDLTVRYYLVDASTEEGSAHVKYRLAFGPKPTTSQIKKGEMPAFDQTTIIDIERDSGDDYSYDGLEVKLTGKAYITLNVDGGESIWSATIPTDYGTLDGEGDSPEEAISAAFADSDIKITEYEDDGGY